MKGKIYIHIITFIMTIGIIYLAMAFIDGHWYIQSSDVRVCFIIESFIMPILTNGTYEFLLHNKEIKQ